MKFCLYFPYNAKLCLSATYAKQQLQREQMPIRLWTTASVRVQTRSGYSRSPMPCRRPRSTRCYGKWLRRLPHPYDVASISSKQEIHS
jgi:hypothetical protein